MASAGATAPGNRFEDVTASVERCIVTGRGVTSQFSEDTQNLVDSTSKRAQLAGALLVFNDGKRLLVPHFKPWMDNETRLRAHPAGATTGTQTFTLEALGAEVKGAYVGVLSPPTGVVVPASYERPIFERPGAGGVGTVKFSVRPVPANPSGGAEPPG